MAAATYPLQLFISYRLLTSRITAPIYKLIILNGTLVCTTKLLKKLKKQTKMIAQQLPFFLQGIFQITVHIFIRQLPAFYECSFIYSFLVENKLEWIAGYLMAFSYVYALFFVVRNKYESVSECESTAHSSLRRIDSFNVDRDPIVGWLVILCITLISAKLQ